MPCEAGLLPVAFGGQSENVDFWRKRRLFSMPQRVARAIRQSFRCRAEGCDRPTAWCDAHHLNPWNRGGNTNLADGVLLCGRHHTLTHHTLNNHPDYQVRRLPGWRISITRTPRETPPTPIAAKQKAIRASGGQSWSFPDLPRCGRSLRASLNRNLALKAPSTACARIVGATCRRPRPRVDAATGALAQGQTRDG